MKAIIKTVEEMLEDPNILKRHNVLGETELYHSDLGNEFYQNMVDDLAGKTIDVIEDPEDDTRYKYRTTDSIPWWIPDYAIKEIIK